MVHLADKAFVRNLALLFKYGSDGDLPYTGPFGSSATAFPARRNS